MGDIWAGRRFYENAVDFRLPCVKGTEDMRPSIVNGQVSPRPDSEVAWVAGHEVNGVTSVAH